MDGMLSQEEINALLGGVSDDSAPTDVGGVALSDEEKDAVGEISNICMGTAATTLYSLVNQKVVITTPVVKITNWEELSGSYAKPCVFINIFYKEGIDGNNVLILKEDDVKIITDLMMGGDGLNPAAELSEIHLSAICEAMNQMMGSSATSLSSMLNRKVDISPPEADLVDMAGDIDTEKVSQFMAGNFVQVTFRMTIGDLVDSTIMQLYPLDFSKELYSIFSTNDNGKQEEAESAPAAAPQSSPAPAAPQPAPQQSQPMGGQSAMGQPMMNQQAMNQPMMGMPMMGGQPMMGMPMMGGQDVNVQNVQFQAFSPIVNPALQQENIDLIMDVPLEVSVVLGRTRKSIKEILEFSPGTIIELDKLAGEPIDVMVNQKLVAKGEVVVIEESFGIRITEIIKEKM
ncbi:MAG: flagellar motor switch phosphatase FliY [Lachnospiraceae bacterium]|nr:flagellar motor switch phosphatase FliY [Lachnospiraceae bacterium]